jgi:subtilisin family serine protease
MFQYDVPGGTWSTMPTTHVHPTTSYACDKYYVHLQGTSMAAPQVSGLAGLLFAPNFADTDGDGKISGEVQDIIEVTADNPGASGWGRNYGWGQINVHNAVVAAHGGGPFENIAILAVEVSIEVVQGDLADVSVTVANVRNIGATTSFVVSVTDPTDSTTVGTQTMTDGPGPCASTTPPSLPGIPWRPAWETILSWPVTTWLTMTRATTLEAGR